VEAEVFLADGSYGKAAVPAGISTGSSEAIQVLDGDPGRFAGKGALKAVETVRKVIAPALKGMRAGRQREIDEKLIGLDGTPNKGKLGANAILGVSLAAAYAAAASRNLPLFRYMGGKGPFRLPVPVYDMLAGGAHAQSTVDLQEYLVIPSGVPTFQDSIHAGFKIYQALREVLQGKGHKIMQPGGPFTPSLGSNREGVEVVAQAIEKAGSTETTKLRGAMEDASWDTPQGKKKMRKGDHQAIVDMVVVQVKGSDFHTVGKVSGEDAVGPDKCDKF